MTERDLKKDMDALKTDLDAVRRDLAALTETLRDSAKAQVAAGVAGAGAELDAVMTQLREVLNSAELRGREGVRAVEAQIEQRPLMTLAVAFVAGLLFGRLLHRR